MAKNLTSQMRKAITTSGYSRYAICKELDIDQGSMSRFMNGQGGLGVKSLDAITEFLGLEIVRKGKRK